MEVKQCNVITNSSIATYSWSYSHTTTCNFTPVKLFYLVNLSSMPNLCLTLQQKGDWSRLIVQQIHLEHHLIFHLVTKKILGTNTWYKTIAIRSLFNIVFSLSLWWPNMHLNIFLNLMHVKGVIIGHKLEELLVPPGGPLMWSSQLLPPNRKVPLSLNLWLSSTSPLNH